MKIVKQINNIQKINKEYELETNCSKIRIGFLGNDVVRIHNTFEKCFNENYYGIDNIEYIDSILIENEKEYIITNNFLKVIININPFYITIKDNMDNIIHKDISELALKKDSNNRLSHVQEIFKDDHYYGFGERSGELDKLHQTMNLYSSDTIGFDPINADNLYKHIPFYIKKNYQNNISIGYLYNTSYNGIFDMGRSHSNYWHRQSSFTVDDGDIDYFFIYGPSVKDVVRKYTKLTGTSVMLPKYALGYLGSSMYYADIKKDADDAILNFIDKVKENDIPIDNFHLSSGYTTIDDKRCVFTWNLDRFKDPKEFFAKMKEKGVDVSCNVKPALLINHPYVKDLIKEDIFIKDENGKPLLCKWWGGDAYYVDFTNPKAIDIWKNYLKEQLFDYGALSIWNDNCEYEGAYDEDGICYKGKIKEYKPLMANIMCKISKDAINEYDSNLRPYIVCRAGHTGIQKYAQTWSGDNYTSWDSLRYNNATILNMALSGVSNYGVDVGGFDGMAPSGELLTRWVQNGIFYPRFSIHSYNTDGSVTEPMMYEEYTPYIRDAIKFRYQLVPYYYSLMKKANEDGLPILRPLMMEYMDKEFINNFDEYMVGDSLLVVPVLQENQTKKMIYLPKGYTFYDFYNYKKYEGGKEVILDVDIESIPLFLKEGSILPIGNKINSIHNDIVEELTYIMIPSKKSEFTYYEDDGITNDYLKGKYYKQLITLKKDKDITISIKSEGSYQSKVKSIIFKVIVDKPNKVLLNNKEIEFKYKDLCLFIEYQNNNQDSQIEILY